MEAVLKVNNSEWGTFKDSLRAPIHSWFTYPAGFSHKAVEHSLDIEGIIPSMTIYDPFMGSGTVNLVAKIRGINSIGVEAHPFVYPITLSKMEWDINFRELESALNYIESQVRGASFNQAQLDEFPELIAKCFLPETLFELVIIRNSIQNFDIKIINFLKTTLICTLRGVSIAATGWPYIAPNKIKITSMSKEGFKTFKKTAIKMYGDIVKTKELSKNNNSNHSTHSILLGDSRHTEIKSESVDLIFTSPPYLNNFDYADRTRLEMYFMGVAKNWEEISSQVRTKLITSATTQISRNDIRYNFTEDFKNTAVEEYEFLKDAVEQLSKLRLIKGGKKSYDLLVTGYFNDLFLILKDNFRVLKPGKKAFYILGDSAPYGVHIPTDILIGKIGVALGFKEYKVDILRTRGGKWKNNPQRHSVALQESIITLIK